MHLCPGFDLKAVLAAAANPNVQFMVHYHDMDRNGDVVAWGQDEIVGNSTTEVLLLTDPADLDYECAARVLDAIHINNADDAAATPTVFFDDGTTNWVAFKAVLAASEVVHFTPAAGWRVLESDGGLKMAAVTAAT